MAVVLPSCMSLGGVSRKTGRPVWSRHRWPGAWGLGRCEFCRYTLDEMRAIAASRQPPQK